MSLIYEALQKAKRDKEVAKEKAVEEGRMSRTMPRTFVVVSISEREAAAYVVRIMIAAWRLAPKTNRCRATVPLVVCGCR